MIPVFDLASSVTALCIPMELHGGAYQSQAIIKAQIGSDEHQTSLGEVLARESKHREQKFEQQKLHCAGGPLSSVFANRKKYTLDHNCRPGRAEIDAVTGVELQGQFEPRFTNCSKNFIGTLDYIFYRNGTSENRLECKSALVYPNHASPQNSSAVPIDIEHSGVTPSIQNSNNHPFHIEMSPPSARVSPVSYTNPFDIKTSTYPGMEQQKVDELTSQTQTSSSETNMQDSRTSRCSIDYSLSLDKCQLPTSEWPSDHCLLQASFLFHRCARN